MHTITKSIAIFVTATLVLNAMAPALAQTENNAPAEVIAGVERFIGERARQVVVAKGRYVGVTYRKGDGKTETVEGFVRERDETELTIRRGIWQKKIPLNGIDVLIVCEHPSQLQRARYILGKESRQKGLFNRDTGVGGKLTAGILAGISLGFLAGTGAVLPLDKCGSGETFCGWGKIAVFLTGASAGYIIGCPLGMSIVDPDDRFLNTLAGSLLGAGAGVLIGSVTSRNVGAAFIVVSPFGATIGSIIMSERSNPFRSRRFSIGLAPDRNGNVSAIATLWF